jgi:hypothetical protein
MNKTQQYTQEYYRLYIDELGTASTKDKTSDVYILSGCSVNKKDCNDLKIQADQIKFKYWGRTDVVFHSNEIGRKKNDFVIFNDVKVFKEFQKDMHTFLTRSKIKLFFIVVDKSKALTAGWNDVKVHKDTTSFLLRNFLLILLTSDSRGEIIIESSSVAKDVHILDSLNFFLGSGIPKMGINYKKVQDTLTSVSFVTKRNHDIEEQIADLFAYAAKIKYQTKTSKKHKNTDYEKMMLDLLNKKIYKIPEGANLEKTKLFKGVDPFLILP